MLKISITSTETLKTVSEMLKISITSKQTLDATAEIADKNCLECPKAASPSRKR